MSTPRRYASALRAEQARLTRRRVIAAAHALFLERGYAATTVAAVAAAAGVSQQTVYNAVGAKPALLKAVYDVALAGDDDPAPIADRPGVRAVQEAPDARTALHRYAALGRGLLERAGPLLALLLAQVPGDPDLREWLRTTDGERATGTARAARFVADRFGLRDGLAVDEAADLLWTLTAPEIAVRLVHDRGWSWDRYEAWLGRVMADSLLGPG
ncbi:TetR/AcrR family transcriptional regulator [Kineococcus glutinatus]|uniref:TetR family transcriptional regulator n=1 Tax=Kineococcus glutinatus TaxID=1070872 RepID=A0ABP9I5R3_9ACTN